jgi:hypothetical protein
MINIELVPFDDLRKPVVYKGKVYQVCVRDWDNDCILKDKINGVVVLSNIFDGDTHYDEALIEVLDNHPFNGVQQIKIGDEIVSGTTENLQSLVDHHLKKE